MIDYDKLKKLHGEELENYLNEHVSYWENKLEMTKKLVADRIDRDKELTKPEPKYKGGTEVFILWHSCIEEAQIVDNSSHGRYQVQLNDGGQLSRIEAEIFPTRESLIEHQIKYWATLFEEEQKEWVVNFIKRYEPQVEVDCDHDGYMTCRKCGMSLTARCQHDFIPFPGALALSNCKKCGESVFHEECQHERGNNLYTKKGYKCIKCGEFYR